MMQNPGLSVSQSSTYSGLPTLTPQFTEHLLLLRTVLGPEIQGCIGQIPAFKELKFKKEIH